MKTTIGGDRLGSGNKQNVSLKNYSRSTHDLSYLWRSSMSAGTLVPFMSEVGLPGDSFDINLSCDVKTLPTVGPLFGSYKVQLDVFSIPIRLYNGKLHMNKLGIGMDMSQIKLPQVRLEAFWDPDKGELDDNEQVNASCIFSYLNIRGLGSGDGPKEILRREFNAIPYLGYWDIYKNYYANKQEENSRMIHIAPAENADYIISSAYRIASNGDRVDVLNAPKGVQLATDSLEITLQDGNGEPEWDTINFEKLVNDPAYYTFSSQYAVKVIDGLKCTWSGWIGTQDPSGQVRVDQQNVAGNISPKVDASPQIVGFPLENIDKAREDILANVRSVGAYQITNASDAPYGLPMVTNDVDEISATEYTQEG